MGEMGETLMEFVETALW